MRSRLGNLPIYTDIRNGKTKVVTILRKFSGDVEALRAQVSSVCGRETNLFHGRLEVEGRHKTKLREWLSGLGF